MDQAVEIDRHDPVPARTLELAPLVDDGALAQHQDIEGRERGRGGGDRIRIPDIDTVIAQARQVRAFIGLVVGGGRAGAPDMDGRPPGPEGLGHAVADAAGAADDQQLPAGEIGVTVHDALPVRACWRGVSLWSVRSGHMFYPVG